MAKLSTSGAPAAPAVPAPRHPRSLARELAVQTLYAWEANRFVESKELLPPYEAAAAGSEANTLAKTLFAGVCAQRIPVDGAIDARLTNWTIHRLAATDRAILRLAVWELLYDDTVPPKVVITEAIHLAKEYGSDDKTPRLINGVLDRLARDHRGLGTGSGNGPALGAGSATGAGSTTGTVPTGHDAG